ncbi:hypothetical protein [Tomitella gaofuii]|nr:hypothetical protein [Tomitella gaofuii]
MTTFECGTCFLSDADFPAGRDPAPFFTRRGGTQYCLVCAENHDEGDPQ